ncbi:MAG TPA: glycine--tRNA ligase [Dehalococcoidia bacterium]|nr:glycine--tRNA ligase [Dehalococcoidia bacterium]
MTDESLEAQPNTDMETLVSLCKRRGFIFQSSEIYGGLQGVWDYGPLGVEMTGNIKRAWWRAMVQERDDIVGIDAAILMHPQVWRASGHVDTFTDPMVDCRNCQSRFRQDELTSDVCPNCGARGEFTEPRMFNLMLRTFLGPVEGDAATVYLRPETAQGIFVNFENVLTSMRRKLPFGIAQIGKSFRNEITPRNFIFRVRELEQMEMEYFCYPEDSLRLHQEWIDERRAWYARFGLDLSRLRVRAHEREELSHYSQATSDFEYLFPIGWAELEGVAHRGSFDLTQHANASGKALSYFDEARKEHIVPHVIEPALGVGRCMLAFLSDAYAEETDEKGEKRVVLRLHPAIAPIKVAVLPLSRNEKLTPTTHEVHATLRKHWMTQYDDAQSIGRRYRRQDEIGTPLCVTVDFQTVEEDRAVTIRERDSMAQVRVPIAGLVDALRERLVDVG